MVVMHIAVQTPNQEQLLHKQTINNVQQFIIVPYIIVKESLDSTIVDHL